MNSTKHSSNSVSRKGRKGSLAATANDVNEAIEASENCVRRHPESSIWTAFGGGLMVGGLIAWAIFEEREHHWHQHVGKLASNLQRRWKRW